MKRQRNRSCIYTGLVGAKLPVYKPRISRKINRCTVALVGGPLAGTRVRLDADGDFNTLSLAATKGFPSGRYEHGTWKPDHEAPQDNLSRRKRLEDVY